MHATRKAEAEALRQDIKKLLARATNQGLLYTAQMLDMATDVVEMDLEKTVRVESEFEAKILPFR